MHVGNYIGLVHASEKYLAEAFKKVAKHHGAEPDVYQMCNKLAAWSQNHVVNLQKSGACQRPARPMVISE